MRLPSVYFPLILGAASFRSTWANPGVVVFFFFFLMIRRPPRSTFFPSPTLFRSLLRPVRAGGGAGAGPPGGAAADRGFPARRHRCEPAGAAPRVVLREVPYVRGDSAARNRRVRIGSAHL